MQIARKRLAAESSKRHHFFRAELQCVQSGLIQVVADICAKEIEDATDRLWEIVRDLLREVQDLSSPEAFRILSGQIDELWVHCSYVPQSQFEAICQRDGVSSSVKNATHFYDRSVGAHMRLQSQVEEFCRSASIRKPTDTVPSNHGRSTKVFLSHAASDEHMALLLKSEIERRVPGVKVFCSSDPADLAPGTKWSPEIQQALQHSALLIFVASDRGLARPWVWFECGTFWFTKKSIMPLCLGGVRKNTLRRPLSELQAVNGDEASDLKMAFDVVASITNSIVSDSSNLDRLSEKLKELDHDAAPSFERGVRLARGRVEREISRV